MTDTSPLIIFSWYIALIASFIAIFGSLMLIKVIPKILSNFKKPLFLLFIAANFAILSSLIVSIFGIISLPVENVWWNLQPSIFLIAMIFYIASTYILYKKVRGI